MKGSLRKITLEGRIKLGVTSALVVLSTIVSIITGINVILPMLLSFGGDVSLMKNRDCFHNRSERDFRTGILFFMFAHIAYADVMKVDEYSWIKDAMIVATMLLIFLILTGVKNNIIAIALYAVVLTLSAINMYHFYTVTFIGGMLFVLSDSLIGLFLLLKKDDIVSQILIWGTYVPAQVIIQSSFLA